MNRCLICFKKVEGIFKEKICNECLNKFEIINKSFYFNDVEVLILYKYNEFFKGILYRYKGCYDKALKEVFLNINIKNIKRKYKGYKIICAPSYKEADKERGFNHVKEIAKLLNLKILDCMFKIKDYKQSSQEYHRRGLIQNIIRIDKTKIGDSNRLLIIDDVATSLSTIKTIIRLLPTDVDKKVLVLASNCRFLEDESICVKNNKKI